MRPLRATLDKRLCDLEGLPQSVAGELSGGRDRTDRYHPSEKNEYNETETHIQELLKEQREVTFSKQPANCRPQEQAPPDLATFNHPKLILGTILDDSAIAGRL